MFFHCKLLSVFVPCPIFTIFTYIVLYVVKFKVSVVNSVPDVVFKVVSNVGVPPPIPVKLAPLTAGRVAGNLASGRVPETKRLAFVVAGIPVS